MREITSTANPVIRHLASLQHKAAVRRETGTFVIEGERLVLSAPAQYLREVYVTAAVWEHLSAQLTERISGDRITLLSDAAMAKVSDTKSPQGILAEALQPVWSPDDVIRTAVPAKTPSSDRERPALLLLLEDIQDPGNLGTMFRTAEAAGASGLILTDRCADIFNPKTVRSTMSSIFRMPFVITGIPSSATDLLSRSGIRTFAACPGADSASFETQDYSGPCAFLIGNEGNGLRRETIQAADQSISIPMQGRIESLNAAMSAGILLYEAARQRGYQ